MRLSKRKTKFITSLQIKKFRREFNKFVAEGEKIVSEMLKQDRIQVLEVCATPEWLEENRPLWEKAGVPVWEATEAELQVLSGLKTAGKVLAVADIPEPVWPRPEDVAGGYVLYLDGIQDPGNLGTILRIADWFGIPYVFCAPQSADNFNPKVIQASMGAFLRVAMIRIELSDLLERFQGIPLLAADLQGESLQDFRFPERGILAIGSEGRGIQEATLQAARHRITIDRPVGGGAESLNASVSCGIICAALRKTL